MYTKQLPGWFSGLWLLLASCQSLPPTEAAQAALDQFTAATTGPGHWATDGHGQRWKPGKLTILDDMHIPSPAVLPTGAPRTAAASLHMDKLRNEKGYAYRFGPNTVDIGSAAFEQTVDGGWYLTCLILPVPDETDGKAMLLEFRPRIRLK